MSVNYIAEINGLDVWELTHPLSATAYKVMRKLQYLANCERFPERISVPNSLLMSLVGCSEDSLIKARNSLIQYGLITYTGRKKITPIYEIMYFSDNNSEKSSYKQGIEQGLKQGIKQGNEQGIKQGTLLNKTKQEKTEYTDDEKGEDEREDERAREKIELLSIEEYRNRFGVLSKDDIMAFVAIEYMFSGKGNGEQVFGRTGSERIKRAVNEREYSIELIEYAADRTVQRVNAPGQAKIADPTAYMFALLRDWTDNGYETIEEIKQGQEDYRLVSLR